MALSKEQKLTINFCLDFLHNTQDKGMVVNGVGGSGKTHTIMELAKYCLMMNWVPVITSFTNRVVNIHRKKTMFTKYGDPIHSTLHKLLYQPVTDEEGYLLYFQKRDQDQILQVLATLGGENSFGQKQKVFIVDESSMVSSKILDHMLKELPGPIIFFGDSEQLPPIGENESLMEEWDVNLNKIHRNAQDSDIIKLATEVRERGFYERTQYKTGDVSFVRKRALTVDFFKHNKFDMILCGTHKRRMRLNHLVRLAEGYYQQTSYPLPGEKITPSDTNSASLTTGDIYTVQECWPDKDNLVTYVKLKEDSDTVFTVPLEYWQTESKYCISDKRRDWATYDWFSFAYAMTVHKAQGSQFDHTLVINEDVSYFLEQRRFLYTAITRAAKSLMVAE